nr:MAG TPA: hypothetical protein [Caudoviricetes sp.]
MTLFSFYLCFRGCFVPMRGLPPFDFPLRSRRPQHLPHSSFFPEPPQKKTPPKLLVSVQGYSMFLTLSMIFQHL